MKSEKQLQVLLADLAVLNVNVHNLHWNVEGPAFKPTHVFLEEMYEDLFTKFDDVAELIKTNGGSPAASLKEYLELSKVEEYADRNWTVAEAFGESKKILEYLINSALEIRKTASDADEFTVANIMEDYVHDWQKTLWMVNAALK